MISKDTEIFLSVAAKPGNFGSTVYNTLFEKLGINGVYIPRTAPSSVETLLSAIRALDIRGCSVTMPLKCAVAPHLDSLDSYAELTGAVNTIVNRSGALHGINADIVGILNSLKELSPKSFLIYGSGAVARSMIVAAKELNASEIAVVARQPKEANRLAEEYGVRCFPTVRIVQESAVKFDIIANATPSGASSGPHDIYDLLEFARSAFDVTVSLTEVPWLHAAKEKGLTVVTGLQMYRHQLRCQFEAYTSRTISLDDIDSALSKLRP